MRKINPKTAKQLQKLLFEWKRQSDRYDKAMIKPRNIVEERDLMRARFANHCEICTLLNRRYRFPNHPRAKDLTRFGHTTWVRVFELDGGKVKHVIDIVRIGKRKGMKVPLCAMTNEELESLKNFYLKYSR